MADLDSLQLEGEAPFVRRPWCLRLAVALLFLGALLNIIYLFNHCPIELSEDESHYWMWSQRLDYGYYSKPPGIAFVIAAAEWFGGKLGLNGDGSGAALMPVIRLPAVLFGLLSGLLSISFTRRLFRDDRAALAVILLSAAVPMFAVGSLLITIDSPMYLCWAATVYCLWRVVEPVRSSRFSVSSPQQSAGARIPWLYLAGLTSALGMLFKPVLIALPLCAALAAWRDPVIRRAFKTWHALGAFGVMLLSQVPVILWNANHGWVTFRHIATQGGLGRQAGDASTPVPPLQTFLLNPLARTGSYLGGQIGGMGGLIFLLLVLATITALKQIRNAKSTSPTPPTPTHSSLITHHSLLITRFTFLLAFFLPLWLFYFLMNFWKGTEVNWPAASYFTGMVLLAGVVVQQWFSPVPKIRRDWRGWTTATILWGILLTAVATNLHRIYPLLAPKLQPLVGTPAYDKSLWNPRKWDPSAGKLRGMQSRADGVQTLRIQMMVQMKIQTLVNGTPEGGDPLLIANRYDVASSLNFYLPGHPFVFCLMSSLGGRQSQFDLWPDLSQMDPTGEHYLFSGRSALLIGLDLQDPAVKALLEPAFTSFGPREVVSVNYAGITLKQIPVYRAYGFRQPPAKKGGIF